MDELADFKTNKIIDVTKSKDRLSKLMIELSNQPSMQLLKQKFIKEAKEKSSKSSDENKK